MYIVEEFGEVMDISAKQVKAACLAAIAGGALLGTVGAPVMGTIFMYKLMAGEFDEIGVQLRISMTLMTDCY